MFKLLFHLNVTFLYWIFDLLDITNLYKLYTYLMVNKSSMQL